MMNFFAHEGHTHIEEVTPTFFDTIYGDLLVNLAPFVLLALIVLAMRKVLRLRTSAQLGVIMAYLLAAGLLTFNIAPIVSITSLVAGFALSLAVAILGINKR
jgi:hypothetical protein